MTDDAPDKLVVYGALCAWWDSIEKAATLPGHGLPCCPHCGSVLFQERESRWWENVRAYARDVEEEGYEEFVRWTRGRCFPNQREARAAFASRSLA